MNKIPPQVLFFSGQMPREAITQTKKEGQQAEQSTKEVRLAYTDKHFAIGDLALAHLLNDTLVLRKS